MVSLRKINYTKNQNAFRTRTVNPKTAASDEHQISPYKINTLANSQVMRIKTITNKGGVNVMYHKLMRIRHK